MNTSGAPFSARTSLAVVAVGTIAFLLFLYAIGAGWNGNRDHDGGAHAAANGLNGFAGLVKLLEAQGHEVSLSRTPARLEDRALLVITPQVFADAEEIASVVKARRHFGPTLLILPKWFAAPAENNPQIDAPRGWVVLAGALAPGWVGEISGFEDAEARIDRRENWRGLGRAGALPAPDSALALSAGSITAVGSTGAAGLSETEAAVVPLITDERGDVLAGYVHDRGAHPSLDAVAGLPPAAEPDERIWPLVIVAEPDLLNNYGLADIGRARVAAALVQATLGDSGHPVVFDLTIAGLGSSRNLLTLAFEPPFLAATLCLLLAALVIAWRGFHRFGPPLAEAPAMAMGKRQLASNSAGLIERARRLHLIGPPYAALVSARLAAALGIRATDPAAREAAIADALAARGLPAEFSERAKALRQARRPQEMLRAARALWTIERTVSP